MFTHALFDGFRVPNRKHFSNSTSTKAYAPSGSFYGNACRPQCAISAKYSFNVSRRGLWRSTKDAGTTIPARSAIEIARSWVNFREGWLTLD
jgi:hypothetical protein